MLPALLDLFVYTLRIGRYYAGDQVIEIANPATGKFDGESATDPRCWARIVLCAATTVASLEASTANAAWCDEWGMDSVTIEAQNAVESRLAIKQGRQLVTTTAYNVGLVKTRFHDLWVGGNPAYDVISFESIANPVFPVAEFERQRLLLPDWKFRMRYRGQLTKPAGVIYSDFDDHYGVFEEIPGYDGPGQWKSGGHLVKPFKIPDTWIRIFGADLGPVNCARGWAAIDPRTDNIYIYREALGGGLTGPEMARQALSYKEPVKLWVGGAASEDDRRREWQLAGVPLIESWIHEVEAGIDHVTSLFKTQRLFIFDTLTGIRSDLGTYKRELDESGEPTHKIADQRSFHYADMLRYLGSVVDLRRRIPEPEPPQLSDRARLADAKPQKRWSYGIDDMGG
jgi:hypothetical protein